MCGRARVGPDAIDQLRHAARTAGRRPGRQAKRAVHQRPVTGSSMGTDSGGLSAIRSGENCLIQSSVDEQVVKGVVEGAGDAVGSDNKKDMASPPAILATDGFLSSFVKENIGPGAKLPVICGRKSPTDQDFSPKIMTWGLIPSYKSSVSAIDHFQLFNKRIETLQQGYFQSLAEKKRCVLFISGFYEWKLVGGKKQPHYVHIKHPMQVAGIFDDCVIDKQTVESFAVLTSSSTQRFSLHDRQPIFLSDDQLDRWLDLSLPPEEVRALIDEVGANYTDLSMPFNSSVEFYPVSTKVTNIGYQAKDCTKLCKLGADLKSFFQTVPSPSKLRKEEDLRTEADNSYESMGDDSHAATMTASASTLPPMRGEKEFKDSDSFPKVGEKRGIVTVIHIEDSD